MRWGPASWVGKRRRRRSGPTHANRDPNETVIMVYTHDWRDTDDVTRVFHELRDLGMRGRLP